MLMIFTAAFETENDIESFENIYQSNKGIMYAHAYSILRDVPSAEDAVQDAFLALADHFEKTYQMDCNQIRGYLIIITRNASYRIYNKRKREISSDEPFETEFEEVPDFTADCENQETRKLVYNCIKELDSKYGDVIMLKYYCDMKEKDIASSLGLSLENVKVRLNRARNILKKKLKEVGYND